MQIKCKFIFFFYLIPFVFSPPPFISLPLRYNPQFVHKAITGLLTHFPAVYFIIERLMSGLFTCQKVTATYRTQKFTAALPTLLFNTLMFLFFFCFVLPNINPLKTKLRQLYLKTQFVPRSKHSSSRL